MHTMEMSESAWHLKLVRCYDDYYTPKSVCGYFWKVLWSICLTFFCLTGGALILTTLLSPVIAVVSYYTVGHIVVGLPVVAIGSALWFCAALGVVWTKLLERKERREEMIRNGEISEQPKGLLGEFWYNLREKTCTRIVLK